MSKKDNNQMAVSDFNLQKISTKEMSEHLDSAIATDSNILVIARRGTGKSVMARDAIAKSGCDEVYLNLSVLERVDMGGYPNVMASAQDKKYVDFLLPQFYEKMINGKKPVVALLDEVDKADPSLWAPLLEFTQFRSVNHRPLPNLKAIIMTGNLVSEGGARPSLPLLDRAEKYLVEADAQSWMDWAGKSGHIHPAITAYINDHPKDLFGAADPEDRYADPSPRSWHRASDLLYKGEKLGWNSTLLNNKVSGCVGKEAGIKYSAYYDHYQQLLPLVEDVYRNKDVSKEYNKLEPTKKLVACMIVCARLANLMDQQKDNTPPEATSYVGKFFQKVSYENVLVAARSQLQVQRIAKFKLDDHKDWSKVIDSINRNMRGSE